MKHTPGPWPYRECIENAAYEIHQQYARFNKLPLSDDEVVGNSHLIQAAPELLDALKGLLKTVRRMDADNPAVAIARSAIAKAEGRS